MKKGIVLMMSVVAVVALAGCGLPDLTADKPAERPAKAVARRPKTSATTTTLSSDWDLRPSTTTTTVAEVEADTTTTVAPADTSAPSTGTAGNAPIASSSSSGSSGGTATAPTPASTGQASASANQPTAGTRTGGDTGTCAYPSRCTSDPHRNGEVGRSGQVAGTAATPVGAGGE